MKWLVKVIFKAVRLLINLILLPLDIVISQTLPEVNSIIAHIVNFFRWIKQFIIYVLSWLPFNATFYSIFGGVLIFILTTYVSLHTIKLVVKWYRTLKP